MRLKHLLSGGMTLLTLGLASLAKAQTLWTGPTTNFTQFDPDASDVILPGVVSITRGGNLWLYNDISDTGPTATSPTDTLWAMNPGGNISNYAALNYVTFVTFKNGDLADAILNKPMVLQLVNEQIYISITFTAWGRHGAGGFAYTRSTPAAITPTPVTLSSPTVSGGSFTFSYNATPGLTYVVLSSTNLTSWVPVATNAAASTPVTFTNAISPGAKYFRVAAQAGP